MSQCVSDTLFAPPERISPTGLARLHAQLLNDSGLCALIDAMPEFAMVVGPTRQVLLGNRTLLEFCAAQEIDSVVGMRPGELLACCHAQEAANGCGTAEACRGCGAIAAILAALDGERASRECRVLRETEQGVSALDLRVWGNPFPWHGETLVLVVASDISSEKRRQVLERIFFHDLLNTAGIINNLTELVCDGHMSFDKARPMLRETALDLINEIRSQRELLEAENDELKVKPGPMQSELFLETVARSYRNRPGAVVQLDPQCAEVFFHSDERLLARVIGNLVKNALEASPEGGVVTLGCSSDGDELSFSVHNPGEIPRPLQLQIFHRSFSTKEPGRGIGTYSVKLLTERYLKGRVSFVSTAEAGTTFTVTYPLDLR